jgi:hypothetical protein
MIENKKIMLVKLAAYYEKTLSSEQIQMYSEQLEEHLTDEACSIACKKYIDNSANEFFPRPISKLIAIIKTPVSLDDDAQEIASKIINAVSKFGWNNYEDAKNYIGERGFDVVKRFGGWQYVCQELGQNIQLTTFNAQIRELLKSTARIENVKQDNVLVESMPKNLIKFKIKEIEK